MKNTFALTPIRFDITPAFRDFPKLKAGELKIEEVSPVLSKVALRRNHHTCQCCGFYSEKYQEVLPFLGNPHDLDELVTLCIFCHQCFRLDQVGQFRSGVLVYLPGISQVDLHQIARDLYRARISQSVSAKIAKIFLDILLSKNTSNSPRIESEKIIGTDDPVVLAQKMRDLKPNEPGHELLQQLKGIRLFPLDRRIIRESDLEFNKFPQILAYWRSKQGPFSGKLLYPWLDYYSKLIGIDPQVKESLPMDFSNVQLDLGEPYLAIAVRFLREASTLFRTLSDEYDHLSLIRENSVMFEEVANNLALNPDGKFSLGKAPIGINDSGEETTYKTCASHCLFNVAAYVRRMEKSGLTPNLQTSVSPNQYEHIAVLLRFSTLAA